jgi:hypothetical protein
VASVILTVPHAVCRDEEDKIKHLCDVVAERVARKLFDLLTDRKHKVMLRIADISRAEVDLNRPEGRNTDYRRNLAEDFSRADFLLDIHSFPMDRGYWHVQIFLLKWVNEDPAQDNRKYIFRLLPELAKMDLDVGTVHAAKENDIVAHALENGLPAILVEFSEPAVADQGNRVVERFAEAFSAFLDTLPKKASESRRVSELLAKLW